MPAEVKRVQSGVYLLFLGDEVQEEELAHAVARYQSAAAQESPEGNALVIEALHITNPLAVARMLPRVADSATSHYVVVGNTPIGNILAARLQQTLSAAHITAAPHQQAAVTLARELRGLPEIPNAHACDYL